MTNIFNGLLSIWSRICTFNSSLVLGGFAITPKDKVQISQMQSGELTGHGMLLCLLCLDNQEKKCVSIQTHWNIYSAAFPTVLLDSVSFRGS